MLSIPVQKSLATTELLCAFGTPISFKDIGRVTNGQMPRKPLSCFMSNFNTCYAPDMSFTSLKQHIETILSSIEGLKYQWDEDYFIWRIEWGTPAREYGLDYKSSKIINHGKMVAQIAACEAITKFPHLIEDYDDEAFEGVPNEQMRKWSKIELRVYWDAQCERVFLELNRMTGCHHTFDHILLLFKNALAELNTN